MDWLIIQIDKSAKWITNFPAKKFLWSFILSTLLLAAIIANLTYFILDAVDKANLLPEEPGLLIICLFLVLWVIVMSLTATAILKYGGGLLRYNIPNDRVDSLKVSGLISKAKTRIWLIGLSLSPFAEQGFLKILEDKIKEGVEVKLLIYDPGTEFAKNRKSSLPVKNDTLSDDINAATRIFTAFKDKIKTTYPTLSDNFAIRLYHDNASMSAFIVDDEARVGLYINNHTGLTAPEIQITNKYKQTDIFKLIDYHFQSIWDGSPAV